MEYKYEALDAQGKEVKGFINAHETSEAISMLRNDGLFPTKINVVGTDSKPCKKKVKGKSLFDLKRPLTTMEKAMMSIISFETILIVGLIMKIIKK